MDLLMGVHKLPQVYGLVKEKKAKSVSFSLSRSLSLQSPQF